MPQEILINSETGGWIEEFQRQGVISGHGFDELGFRNSNEFLLKNLALSLTDCYWVQPEGAGIHWKDVNFYDNDFGIIRRLENSEMARTHYTPDASTSGNLPKFWVSEGRNRYLIKGNEGGTYQQSFNEVFATRIHKAHGFSDYVAYSFVNIKERGTGCKCKAFTDSENEFISAWDIFGHENYKSGEMSRNGFAELLAKNGLDKDECRLFLGYMALTNFVLANVDRHFNNLGVIRDSNTLKFKKIAPIFDTGNSMGFGSVLDMNVFLNAKTFGFDRSFQKSIATVHDMKAVNIGSLPSADDVRTFYEDSGMSESNILKLGTLFQNRVNILEGLQQGKSFYDLTLSWRGASLTDNN